jgi:hypothetical protein
MATSVPAERKFDESNFREVVGNSKMGGISVLVCGNVGRDLAGQEGVRGGHVVSQ